MYPVSDKFTEAVYRLVQDGTERIRMQFGDTLLTNEDIHMSAGIKLIEAANLEEELTIGACVASNLSGTIMNYHRLLDGFEFGACEVSLGIRTDVYEIDDSVIGSPARNLAGNPNVYAIMRYREGVDGTGGSSDASADHSITFSGHSEEPYLRVNGSAPTAQPPFPVFALYITGATVTCIAEDGRAWIAHWVDGRTWSELQGRTWDSMAAEQWDAIQGHLVPAVDSVRWMQLQEQTWDEVSIMRWSQFVRLPEYNAFMLNKFAWWAKNRRGIAYRDGIEYEFFLPGQKNSSGQAFPSALAEEYEYAKLGVFMVDTPERRKMDLVQFSALDRMKLFDLDATDFWSILQYPITMGEIYRLLCDYVGVTSATQAFINSTRAFSEAPAELEGYTAREILGWIAEAACTFARFTRDGELELAWFSDRPVRLPMHFDATVAEYEVAPIDKLHVASSQDDIGVIIGDGQNGYQIIDNPMLYGSSDTEIRQLVVPIYNRLSAFQAFYPITARAKCNWAIQAGDVIIFEYAGEEYRLPIYEQTITWNGAARVVYESTGKEKRPVMEKVNRRIFEQNRAMHELRVTVDGIFSDLEDVEGRTASLEFTTGGLKLAIDNNKLTFDANGLTVKGGGIRVQNNAGTQVLYADTSGNLNLTGTVHADAGDIGGFSIDGGKLSSSGLTIDPSGRIDFGNYGNIQADSSSVFLSAYRPLYIQGSPSINIGPESDDLTVTSSAVEIYPSLYLWNVRQSPGGNVYLAWNQSTREVMYSSSSERYKYNIRDLTDDDYDIMQFNVRAYTDKSGQNTYFGEIAEELIEACPSLVTKRYVNGKDIPETIDYIQQIPIAFRELQVIWKTLEANGISRLKEAI